MTEKKQFKDKCDNCGKFAILKGVAFTGKRLCENCIHEFNEKSEEKNEVKKTESNLSEKQLTLFDMEVFKNDMVGN